MSISDWLGLHLHNVSSRLFEEAKKAKKQKSGGSKEAKKQGKQENKTYKTEKPSFIKWHDCDCQRMSRAIVGSSRFRGLWGSFIYFWML